MLRKIAIALVLTFVLPHFTDASTVQIPRTGQSACYDTAGTVVDCAGTGQDGAFLAGKPWSVPRFVDNSDGTITDNLTGLIWLKNANCKDASGGVDKGAGTLTWANALTWSNALGNGKCGLTDGSGPGQWRLPNREEMNSLVDASRYSPAIMAGHPFTNVQSNSYWSSTTSGSEEYFAWFLDVAVGYFSTVSKDGVSLFVWPVRGGQ